MAGTSWPTLTAGQIARAGDVNSLFAWLQGSIVPQNLGSTTDNAYDLGTTTANWRTIYTYSLGGTTTAKGVAIGTTSVANQSDVAFEIAGTRAMLWPRLTTTQRTALTSIDGMTVYDSTLNQFYVRENGAWKVMLGSAIGIIYPQAGSTTSVATSAMAATAVPGRVLRVSQAIAAGLPAKLEFYVDGLTLGDFSNTNSGTTAYLVLGSLANGVATATMFAFTTAAASSYELGVFFKNNFSVYHRSGSGAQVVQTTVYLETA